MSTDNPTWHASDPPTSVIAALEHEQTGRRARHMHMVLAMVVRQPLATAIELWHSASAQERATLKEPQEIRRRLTDLLARNKVRQEEPRVCRVRGTRMVTWTTAITNQQKTLF